MYLYMYTDTFMNISTYTYTHIYIYTYLHLYLHLDITPRSARTCASACFLSASNVCTCSLPPRTLFASLHADTARREAYVCTSHTPVCRA